MQQNKFILYLCVLIICIKCVFANNANLSLLSMDIATLPTNTIIASTKPHLIFSDSRKANLWLVDMSNRLKRWITDKAVRNNYLIIIQYEAMRAGIDPQLILSIITAESKFNKYAISPKGARGLMQIMPFWQYLIGNSQQDLFDVQTNIRYGCTILRYYLEQQNWDFNKALALYNGSYNQMWYPNLIFTIYNSYWKLYPVATVNNGKLIYINF